MLTFTKAEKDLIKELQQRVNDLENANQRLLTLIKGTGSPVYSSFYIWNPDQLKYQLITASGVAGNEQLNITL